MTGQPKYRPVQYNTIRKKMTLVRKNSVGPARPPRTGQTIFGIGPQACGMPADNGPGIPLPARMLTDNRVARMYPNSLHLSIAKSAPETEKGPHPGGCGPVSFWCRREDSVVLIFQHRGNTLVLFVYSFPACPSRSFVDLPF
jgi:hypothetical protein